MKRLRLLEERRRDHLEHVRLDRGKRIEKNGLPAERIVELTRGRAKHSRRTDILENDPAARAQASQYSREMEANRLQAGGKPKEAGTGKNRKLKSKKDSYPPYFMDRLISATRIWAREYGKKYVYWNHLVALFDLLLIHEQTALGVVFTSTGKPKYLHYSYLFAVGEVLVRCENVKGSWRYLEHNDKKKIKARQTEDLILIVFNLVYKE